MLEGCGGGGASPQAAPTPTTTLPPPTIQEIALDAGNENLDGRFNSERQKVTGGEEVNRIVTGSGDDEIDSGGDNDLIRPGAGGDTVNAGAGDDTIVILGRNVAGDPSYRQYLPTDLTDVRGEGVDVSPVVTPAEVNNNPVDEAIGDVRIDGGSGMEDTLVVYGMSDLSGVDIVNIERLLINSDVTVGASQLEASGIEVVVGGDGAVLRLINDGGGGETAEVALSALDLAGVSQIEVGENVALLAATAADLDGIVLLLGDGEVRVESVDPANAPFEDIYLQPGLVVSVNDGTTSETREVQAGDNDVFGGAAVSGEPQPGGGLRFTQTDEAADTHIGAGSRDIFLLGSGDTATGNGDSDLFVIRHGATGVTITDFSGADVIRFAGVSDSDVNGVSASGDSVNGYTLTVTLNNGDSYSVALGADSDHPGALPRHADFFRDLDGDGIDASALEIWINSAPVVAVPDEAQRINQDESLIFSSSVFAANALLVSDANGDTLTMTIRAAHGTLHAATGESGGSLAITGSAAEINGALDGLEYTPGASPPAEDTLVISVTDTVATTTGTVTIGINRCPSIDAVTLNVGEETASGGVVGTVSAADEDGDAFEYSITAGNDDGLFVIDAATGVVTIADGRALDYESVSLYTLEVTVTEIDSGGLSGSAAVTVAVTDVNEPPVVSGDMAFSVGVGLSYQLTVADLWAVDGNVGGGSAAMRWQITDTPAHGHLALRSALATEISAFTQAQLEAGDVFYVSDTGGSATADSFDMRAETIQTPPQTAAVETINVEIVQDVELPDGRYSYRGDNPWLSALLENGGQWQTIPAGASLVVIEYAFRGGVTTSSGQEYTEWLAWEENALRAAMEMWESVCNIDFVEVEVDDDPDIQYWKTDLDGNTRAFHNIPHGEHTEPLLGVFDDQVAGWSESGVGVGGYGFETIMHELGHGLGLRHPHDGDLFPGVADDAHGDLGDYHLNQAIYTIMSYNDGWIERYPNHANPQAGREGYGWAATPMAFDIAAIQELYGANTVFHAGDDIYTLPGINGGGAYWSCIWDTCGDDTISATGAVLGCEIDLRAADLVGEGGGGYVSYHDGIVGGFTIANTVVIENAIGGGGDDVITGNAADNILTGGSGADVFVFYGNFGGDTITDFNVAEDGIRFAGAGEVATRDEFITALRLDGGDVVYDVGNDGVNVLRLSGVAGIAGVFAAIADTVVIDNAVGGAGDDVLTGDAADNILTGGGGADIFIFHDDFGSDTITDFNVAEDTIQFVSAGEAATRDEFIAALRPDGGDVVYDVGNDGVNVLRLSGVTRTELETDLRGSTVNELRAVGDEFRVNSYTSGAQRNPAVAALGDGGFIVTWGSWKQDGGVDGVYAQRYDGAGNTVGGEFLVNSETAHAQKNSAVAALSNGGFVVVWESDKQDGDGDGIYAQRYDSAGDAVGGEFRVNSYTAGSQSAPAVAALSDGGFVVAWVSEGQDGSDDGVYAQRYDNAGDTVGGEFLVNSETAKAQLEPAVATLGDGGFVVTWQSHEQDGSKAGIYAQRYDSAGDAVGEEFQVNSRTGNNQRNPAVAVLSDGGFVVAWESWKQDGNDYGVYAQRYDSAGNTVGGEFLVNSGTAHAQWEPAVAALGDGGFVVTWGSGERYTNNFEVYAQRYDSTGNTVGGEFLVNTEVAKSQRDSSVAALSDGDFIVTWESNRQDGSSNGVYAQRYGAGDWFVNDAEPASDPPIAQSRELGDIDAFVEAFGGEEALLFG